MLPMRRVRRTLHIMATVNRVLVGVAVATVLLPMAVFFWDSDLKTSNLDQVSGRNTLLKKLLSISDSSEDLSPTAKRFRTADEYCAHYGSQQIRPNMFKHIIYNDKYKILYCQIPKVACTNWRRMMLMLTGKMNTSDPMTLKAPLVHKDYDKYLTYLSDLPMDQIENRLNTYHKFIFTREPFERILSAYRNKFTQKNPFFHQRYGKNIVKRYRASSEQTDISGKDVSFYEYVLYLTDYTRKESLNEHWERMTHLCHPCLVKYDTINSYDDLEGNSNRLLRKIQAPKNVKFPERGQSYKLKGTGELLRQYYKQIPSGLLEQLVNVYYSDFIMFGYKIPTAVRNLTNWQLKL